MKKIKDIIVPKFQKKSSRLELIFRIPYGVVVYIFVYLISLLIMLWSIWAVAVLAVHAFYILFTGTRWKFGYRHIGMWYEFAYLRFYKDYLIGKVMPYFLLLTDKRCGFDI